MGVIILGIVVVFALILIIKNIQVVQQSKAYVIERMGAFSTVWEVGQRSYSTAGTVTPT
mgnify:CR=1 FL=1